MKSFDYPLFAKLARQEGTPLWIYNADIIRWHVQQLKSFDTIRYAQKACSNTHILRFMRELGVQVDAVSWGEIQRALHAGYLPTAQNGVAPIVYVADILDSTLLPYLATHKIEVNAGSMDMLEQLGAISLGHRVWLRINPGFGYGHSRQTNTGGKNSKHGIWHTDLQEAMRVIKRYRLHLVGLHIHIGSGVDTEHLKRVSYAMIKAVKGLGCDIEAISAGGGLTVPYRSEEKSIHTESYYAVWRLAQKEIEQHLGHAIRLEIEPGRFLIAKSGVLIAEVRSVKKVGSHYFVLVDAGFNDFIRPTLYGSYHHIALMSSSGEPLSNQALYPSVIAGCLCESGDMFTQAKHGVIAPRNLPLAKAGDYVVFHDTGAYGASMSSNYNSRLHAAEWFVDGSKSHCIRRRQTIEDLLALETTDVLG